MPVAVPAAAAEQEGSEAARVTYACRGCRSILFSELDVRPHHAADADEGLRQVDFKPTRKGGKSGKGNAPRGRPGSTSA